MSDHKKGFAGHIAALFVRSKLTPVLVVVSLLLGLLSVYLTPKEEEPQISVPMIDIHTRAPGFSSKEIERKVSEIIERAVWGLEGVEYVYSTSSANESLVTVRFKVGDQIEPSLVKIHHKLMTLRRELPAPISVPEVKTYTVDDVPFLVLTFSSANHTDIELRQYIASLGLDLSATPDLAKVEILGGQKRVIRVVADPQKMSVYGVSFSALNQSLRSMDALGASGKNWSNEVVLDVEVGGRLNTIEDVKNTPIGQFGGNVVYVKDIATITDGPEAKVRSSMLIKKGKGSEKAVSLVFAKRKGANIVRLSDQIIHQARVYSKTIPADIQMNIVRDYGETANQKTKDLIGHLLLASFSVSALIAIFMGIRAAVVVGIAIPVTLALTLAVYYLFGYTLNRVTLFALVFSIGILVDDAIVVVENIERHSRSAIKNIIQTTINAVSEVGNSTILATFTVIAAILPMAYVRGLMGPYMKPIPVGASVAMLLSLLVAFIVTPWLAVKILKPGSHAQNVNKKTLDKIYQELMTKLLSRKIWFLLFCLLIVVLLLLASSMMYFKIVKVKMLPFDNKQEFQVLIDYPASTSLEHNIEWTRSLADRLIQNSNVESVQIFSGEPAPFSFSGMVKHTFLRHADYMSDLQVVLKRKEERKLDSHTIIEKLRPIVDNFAREKQANTKVLEIPPGPPVIATVIAEIYGPDEKSRAETAKTIKEIFSQNKNVVDLDTSLRPARSRIIYSYNADIGGLLGINAETTMKMGQLVFSENTLTSLSDVSSPESIGVVLAMDQKARSSQSPFDSLILPSKDAGSVGLTNALSHPVQEDNVSRHRKNLKSVVYVTSELSGAEEAPVYNIFNMARHIKIPLQTASVPWNTALPVIKWDGEWFITYEVFRDLGAAFMVVMVLIYILVLGWFRSYAVPLVIMAPIPISLIGILPGHALIGCFFTATSMIGFIAGAGIIVRNSIILVDFIEQQLCQGMSLQVAVINAGVLRFRPMLLTAAAVIVGSSVMLSDPIFQGLAVSLIFGEVAGTFLSRFAVPVLYYWFIGERRMKMLRSELSREESLHEH